jgi:hypothetical protein
VTEPVGTLDALCHFLGVEPESRMLDQRVTSMGARVGEAGFDARAADRWRSRIGTRAKRTIEVLLGRRLREMGYEEG